MTARTPVGQPSAAGTPTASPPRPRAPRPTAIATEPSTAPAETAVAVDLLSRTVELARITRSRERGVWRLLRGSVISFLLADVVAAVFAYVVRHPVYTVSAALYLLMMLPIRAGWGLYRPRLRLSVLDELPKIVISGLAGIGIGGVTLVVIHKQGLMIQLVTLGTVFVAASTIMQVLAYAALRRLRRVRSLRRPTLIIGAGRVGRQICAALQQRRELGQEVIGFLDPLPVDAYDLGAPLLTQSTERTAELIVENQITTVIVTVATGDDALVDVMLTCAHLGADIHLVPRLHELATDDDKTDWVDGIPLVRAQTNVTSRLSWSLKRVADAVLSALAVAVLSPLILAAAVVVLVENGRPLLFRQRRIGLDGRGFELLKFRTMREPGDRGYVAPSTAEPLAHIGGCSRLLRRISLDELPQLLNVVRGDMSLVGPRPEEPDRVARFVQQYPGYWARHRIPAGLTGWAQVNRLRGDTSIAQRATFDNYYIANWSLWLDVKIMLLTLREVLRGSGS